ncbi:MAG: tRNA (adenosine(37)-N6)-dimethylallyltransferase MiaA [Hymenobacteraceae bacterium]|nr:tRNA (adenosine(37)-N6)-dimethylallyltransferase MiaA [Hymenobacteraceae bacterium]
MLSRSPIVPVPTLLLVAGPTAVGKTALSVELAQQLGTEIVSFDARQFYRELRIGTAKPTAEEQAGVRHHFIDSHSVRDDYSAGRFAAAAVRLLTDDLFPRLPVVVAVGGSGLYQQALTDGLPTIPATDPALRPLLIARLAADGLPALVEELRGLDPVGWGVIDRQNPQRVLRALEVTLGTGRPFSSFRAAPAEAVRPWRTVFIGLDRPRAELYARCDARVDAMLAAGLEAEARALLPLRHLNALQTVGYQEWGPYFEGAYDYAEAVRLLKRNTRRYAKRQTTWFRREAQFQWFHPAAGVAPILRAL